MSMNIFNRESVFLGEHPFEAVAEATTEFFKLAKEIRSILGGQGYLLNNYLSMVFESANNKLAHDAANEGFEVFCDLFGICTAIQGEHCRDMTKHPFYETAKKYIENHPLEFQENSTVRDLYCVALSNDFINSAVKKFIENEKQELNSVFESIQLQEYYSKIAYLAGEEKIGRLAELLKNRFLIAKPVNIFLQAITNQFLYCLNHRDKETSKQIFQLILDEKIEILEDVKNV